jgi:hypothetical protein
MVHVAIHDALNAIDRRSRPYAYDAHAEGPAPAEAAVAGVGHDILVALIPRAPSVTPDDSPESVLTHAFDALGWRTDQLRPSDVSAHRQIHWLLDFLTARARDDRRRILIMWEIDADTRREVVDCLRQLIRHPEPLSVIITGLPQDLAPPEALPRTRFETVGELSKGELKDAIAQLTRDFGQRSDFTEMVADRLYGVVSHGLTFNRDLAAAVESFISTGSLPTADGA